MNKRLLFYCILTFVFTFPTQAQDSLLVLEWEDYIEWIRIHHPVAQQANLQPQFGKENLRSAKGNFDPILYGDWYGKNFKQTQYYDRQNAGIVLPTTLLGMEFSANYENNSGVYLNPERNVPGAGLLSAGVSVNLGAGLLIDAQRAALQQARIFNNMSRNDRNMILNRLYLDANIAFWHWYRSYQDMLTIREGLDLAQARYKFVVGAYQQGELPAIDTVEAFSQVQNRTYQLREMERRLFESQQQLSVFLWDEQGRPVELYQNTVPGESFADQLNEDDFSYFFKAVKQHPEILNVQYKINMLEVDQRLKAEYLKPKLAVKYNFLTENINNINPETNFFTNDYQFGLSFAYPLFIRRARGDWNIARLKIQEASLDQDFKIQQVVNRLQAEVNSYEQYQEQLNAFQLNIQALRRLLEGERQRFEIGESSLFIINVRENSLIDAQMIMNDLRAKKEIAQARARWAAGLGLIDEE